MKQQTHHKLAITGVALVTAMSIFSPSQAEAGEPGQNEPIYNPANHRPQPVIEPTITEHVATPETAPIEGAKEVEEPAAAAWTFFDLEPYLGIATSYTNHDIDSGGFNTAGGFSNSNDDDDFGAGGSFLFGLGNLYSISDEASIRLETELTFYDDNDFTTDSFPGPPGPIAFFYQTNVSSWGGFVNAYLDYDLPETFLPEEFPPLTIFAGGGIGAFRHHVTTTDTVVFGEDRDTDFAWNIGGGAQLEVLSGIDITLGARYLDLGESNISLSSGGPAGNYSLEHTAFEGRIGLNIALENIFEAF